jgi:uncharacterized membrane protein
MMSAPHADQLVSDYLGRLDSALAGLPKSRREEILDEIANHIADERRQLADESDTDVLNLLDRVGSPAEVAGAARDETVDARVPQPSRRIGAVEILALVLTPLIWPAGVILLWLSPAWNTRDKLIGTLVPPGGYLFVVFLPDLLLFGAVSTCSGGSVDGTPIATTCTGVLGLPIWQQDLITVASVGALLILLVLPILTAIYLARQARKWSSQPQA